MLLKHFAKEISSVESIYLLPTIQTFNDPEKDPLENIVVKGKILVTRIFSVSHTVVYPFHNKFHSLSHIWFVVCNCIQIGSSRILLFGKVKRYIQTTGVTENLHNGKPLFPLYYYSTKLAENVIT